MGEKSNLLKLYFGLTTEKTYKYNKICSNQNKFYKLHRLLHRKN